MLYICESKKLVVVQMHMCSTASATGCEFVEAPRLTFENTISKILEEGYVKSMRTPGGHI